MNPAERLEAAIAKLTEAQMEIDGPVPPLMRWHDQEGIPGWDGFIVLGDSADDGDECNPLARFYTVEGAEAALTLARTIDPILTMLRRDLHLWNDCATEPQRVAFLTAYERAGDRALVDAILGSDS
ncbi:hypothetical protein [Agromyces sp. NPDC058064]|uniref:hypothetical protein n=1 Tax=Agromyces sp. NPDC058064 TaxID=3346322 RepID=UPI0036D9FB60